MNHTVSVEGFDAAAQGALETMRKESRVSERILAFCIQKTQPVRGKVGWARGKWIVSACLVVFAYRVVDGDRAVVTFNCGDALNRMAADTQWIEADECLRIKKRFKQILPEGLPGFVELFILGDDSRREESLNWIEQMFETLSGSEKYGKRAETELLRLRVMRGRELQRSEQVAA